MLTCLRIGVPSPPPCAAGRYSRPTAPVCQDERYRGKDKVAAPLRAAAPQAANAERSSRRRTSRAPLRGPCIPRGSQLDDPHIARRVTPTPPLPADQSASCTPLRLMLAPPPSTLLLADERAQFALLVRGDPQPLEDRRSPEPIPRIDLDGPPPPRGAASGAHTRRSLPFCARSRRSYRQSARPCVCRRISRRNASRSARASS